MANDKTIKSSEKMKRPAVVVVLGHIDHGKTSLLMAIKDFKILSKESGGITQHVGAYQIEHNNQKITFIDTPGHESFSAIRSRGSKVADIAILVIDAAEGIKKQTKEAISHIKKANLSTIVAFNKIDKPEANPERVKQQLMEEDIIVESFGGQVPSVNISAKTGKGITDLLDLILLVAEMEELEYDLDSFAVGTIIEAYQDSRRGPTCTAIMEKGILKSGAFIATDSAFGKVKNLEDFLGKQINEAFPSDPVVIVGFESMPIVGENFIVFQNMDQAMAHVKPKKENISRLSFEDQETENNKKYLNLVVKADAFGSLEAIEEVIKTLPQETVGIKIIKAEVGNVNESDIKLAKSAKGAVIAFRVKTDKMAEIAIQKEQIRVYDFEIIYTMAQKIRELMERKLIKEKERTDLGKMEITVIFRTEKNRQIIGGLVTEGEVAKGSSLEIMRLGEKIGQGRIIDVQANKKSFPSMKAGKECAILYQGNEKIKEGDEIISYKEDYIREEL
ncbi:MAG: translation initiation factor IF-2 [Candidatus Paceibacterota bacterium]|jgi:translation initiation factor IF-2